MLHDAENAYVRIKDLVTRNHVPPKIEAQAEEMVRVMRREMRLFVLVDN